MLVFRFKHHACDSLWRVLGMGVYDRGCDIRFNFVGEGTQRDHWIYQILNEHVESMSLRDLLKE